MTTFAFFQKMTKFAIFQEKIEDKIKTLHNLKTQAQQTKPMDAQWWAVLAPVIRHLLDMTL